MTLLSLPSRTDRDLYPALMSPQLNAKYPADHKAFVRIDVSLRIYWHTLFDICPELLGAFRSGRHVDFPAFHGLG